MIALVPIDPSTLPSLQAAFGRLGYAPAIVDDPGKATTVRLLVLASTLPFAAAHTWLRLQGWWSALPSLASSGMVILGLDGAAHLLTEGSEEAPKETGLGLLPGYARRLGPGVRVPNLGWRRVTQVRESPLGDPMDGWLYFGHTYALPLSEATQWSTRHGEAFTALAMRGKVAAIQARPDLSGPLGALLLQRLIQWAGM